MENREETASDNAKNSADYSDDVAKRQNRLSAHSFADLPEVVPADFYQGKEVISDYQYPGKQVVNGPAGNGEKEIANPEKEIVHLEQAQAPEVFDGEDGKEAVPTSTAPSDGKPHTLKERLNRRICGVRLKWALLGIILLIVLIIVLGVGLGVGLQDGSE